MEEEEGAASQVAEEGGKDANQTKFFFHSASENPKLQLGEVKRFLQGWKAL